MTIEELRAKIIDVPALNPYEVTRAGERRSIHKRSEYACDSMLGSNDEVGIGTTESGKFVAVWDGHADLFESMDELRKALNCEEQKLLPDLTTL